MERPPGKGGPVSVPDPALLQATDADEPHHLWGRADDPPAPARSGSGASRERGDHARYRGHGDGHAGYPLGYGFPIGGVAAFDYDSGVISPGGIGYDINCGVRLIRTD